MSNPNIGFKMVKLILNFYNLDGALRCHKSDIALAYISIMINALRGLRRAIQMDKNILASINGRKVKTDETESN